MRNEGSAAAAADEERWKDNQQEYISLPVLPDYCIVCNLALLMKYVCGYGLTCGCTFGDNITVQATTLIALNTCL